MEIAGELRVSERGQMSLPANARRRWDLTEGGQVGYIDLGDVLVVVPGGVAGLRSELFSAISAEDWAQAQAGFGDPELANQ